MRRRLLEMDSRSFERLVERDPIVIVPVGALEAHGPHLPLGADEIQAERTAEALAERIDGYLAPTVSYGVCPGARTFPGTVSLTLPSLMAQIEGILGEFARMGVRRLLVLSGHAERSHMAALRAGAESAARSYPSLRVVVLSDYDFVYELRGDLAPSTDGHGGLLETSRVLALAPELVGPDRPVVSHTGSPFVPTAPTRSEWPESVQGDTRTASREIGERIQRHVLERLDATVRELLPKA